MEAKTPQPPFTFEITEQKVRAAQGGRNNLDPQKVSMAHTANSQWRNRAEFVTTRDELSGMLTRKWDRQLDYRVIKKIWGFSSDLIAVHFAYAWHNDAGNWFRSYGNQNWEFAGNGLVAVRLGSINDLPINAEERKYFWPSGRRLDDHPSLTC